MNTTVGNIVANRSPDIAVPARSLAALHSALSLECGADVSAQALRVAGHSAGDALFASLSDNQSPSGKPASQFWREVMQIFTNRGWGQLQHADVHEGVGALDSTNWAEADRDDASGRPSCHFTTGMLANLLGRAAGSEIAVIEAECKARGDARCRFLFGAPDTLDALYPDLAAGASSDDALASLR